MSTGIPFARDGETALWATERKRLPTGEWVITVWLNTEDDALSNTIHKNIARVVRKQMEESLQAKEIKGDS